MSRRKKLTSGPGWELVSADSKEEEPAVSLPPQDQNLKVRVEKRSKGKSVTSISGFALTPEDLKKLAKELKKRCGAGGTVKGLAIEIQGNVLDQAKACLKAKGFNLS